MVILLGRQLPLLCLEHQFVDVRLVVEGRRVRLGQLSLQIYLAHSKLLSLLSRGLEFGACCCKILGRTGSRGEIQLAGLTTTQDGMDVCVWCYGPPYTPAPALQRATSGRRPRQSGSAEALQLQRPLRP
jgi:hypothetical protein